VLPRTILRGSFRRRLIATSLVLARSAIAQSPSLPPRNEDGYDLWLR